MLTIPEQSRLEILVRAEGGISLIFSHPRTKETIARVDLSDARLLWLQSILLKISNLLTR